MTKEEYISNPTGASSLPFWKTNTLKITKRIKLVNNVSSTLENKYFFKLVHYLDNIEKPILKEPYTFSSISLNEYVNHINSCYQNIGITYDELENYKSHNVYDESLWVAIKDKDKVIATGIAEFDSEIKEGIIEWLQVSKDYRGQGIGKIIVQELLYRLKGKADFVTVSGDMNNPNNPLSLYRSCGFKDIKIWHICV